MESKENKEQIEEKYQANLRAMKRIGRLMVRLFSLQLKNNNLCTRGSIN